MVTHVSAWKMAYKDETALASGGGATQNSPTELIEANLTAIDKHRSWTPAIPKGQRENLYSVGGSEYPEEAVLVQIDEGSGSGTAYLQTDILYNWATSATRGNDGTTKAWRFNTDSEKDLYGCYVDNYEIQHVMGQPLLQSYSYFSTQAKLASTTPIAGSGIPAYSTAAFQVWSDADYTIDSKTITNLGLKDLTYRVNNVWTIDRASSSDKVVNIALERREVEIDVNFNQKSSNTWQADIYNSTNQYVTAALDFGLFTLTMDGDNELLVVDQNEDEISQEGFIPADLKLRAGKGFSPVKS